jgi:hypothetical protein
LVFVNSGRQPCFVRSLSNHNTCTLLLHDFDTVKLKLRRFFRLSHHRNREKNEEQNDLVFFGKPDRFLGSGEVGCGKKSHGSCFGGVVKGIQERDWRKRGGGKNRGPSKCSSWMSFWALTEHCQ